jgi:redox-sensitive bicupin YhaK (pirin superfamily)
VTRTTAETALLHLTPDDYHVLGAEDFAAPGLTARESVGPFVPIEAIGPLVTVHDSTFAPRSGIGHHPHQRMERLFYILDGAVDHDDALNHITGHMGTGDLGILTEGRRGMIHSEWNNTDATARCYVLVYPTDPLPPTASFAAIRDSEAPRSQPSPGVTVKHVVTRDDFRLHGDVRVLDDVLMEPGARLDVELGVREAGLLFLVEGEVGVAAQDATAPASAVSASAVSASAASAAAVSPLVAAADHTVLVPPDGQVQRADVRRLGVTAREPSRVLAVITGPGYGVRHRR